MLLSYIVAGLAFVGSSCAVSHDLHRQTRRVTHEDSLFRPQLIFLSGRATALHLTLRMSRPLLETPSCSLSKVATTLVPIHQFLASCVAYAFIVECRTIDLR